MPPSNSYNTLAGKKHSLGPIIAISVLAVLLATSATFGIWAYTSRQDYKDNTDQKVTVAVEQAQKQTAEAKDLEFIDKEKLPLTHYNGPAAYGSIDVSYPKTWSAYVDESGQSGSAAVSGFFAPKVVPTITNQKNIFALRLEVVSSSYSDVLKQFESQIQANKVKVAAYALPKVPSVSGSRVNGEIITGKQGSMIILPLRDKTLKIWTESPEFSNDFDNNILANFTFSP